MIVSGNPSLPCCSMYSKAVLRTLRLCWAEAATQSATLPPCVPPLSPSSAASCDAFVGKLPVVPVTRPRTAPQCSAVCLFYLMRCPSWLVDNRSTTYCAVLDYCRVSFSTRGKHARMRQDSRLQYASSHSFQGRKPVHCITAHYQAC